MTVKSEQSWLFPDVLSAFLGTGNADCVEKRDLPSRLPVVGKGREAPAQTRCSASVVRAITLRAGDSTREGCTRNECYSANRVPLPSRQSRMRSRTFCFRRSPSAGSRCSAPSPTYLVDEPALRCCVVRHSRMALTDSSDLLLFTWRCAVCLGALLRSCRGQDQEFPRFGPSPFRSLANALACCVWSNSVLQTPLAHFEPG